GEEPPRVTIIRGRAHGAPPVAGSGGISGAEPPRPRTPRLRCRIDARTPPFPGEEAVLLEVLVPPPPPDVLPETSLVAHAEPPHHPPGCRVADEVLRMDAVQAELSEAETQQRPGRLGGVPA